ncbi:MAG: DUF504 domain-containing protein [Thermoproteus sp. AZ2]|jgi:uncharacterized protein (UPF0248 family)|uniref:DUF504 domain-containing protein n=1 Tax=Thermoproteus sp. AZ2 TaxID=1609232 RepID=A0ACC6UY39_9CREN
MNPIRAALNKLKWTGSTGVVVYINRGSPGDLAEISTDEIVEIGANGFTTARGTYIPYHRVVEVRDSKGSVLIRRRPER